MYGAFLYHEPRLGSASPSHSRSLSLGPSKANTPRGSLSKAKSTTHLGKTNSAEQSTSLDQNKIAQDTSFGTLADPRTASMTDLTTSSSSSTHHPDLNNEVATLSSKLISAINHQTTLDDTLSQTKHELEASRARIAQLEAESKVYEEKVSKGDLMTRQTVDELYGQLTSELASEKKQKHLALSEKRGIESEIESLTASLFDEANKMVAAANMERNAVEKKNQQLRDQIKDGEAVISSQTEQLAELKSLMQQIGSDYRKELDSPSVSIAPSSPGVTKDEANVAKLLEAMNLSPVLAGNGGIVPSPSTSLTHLLKPQCRIDVPAYDDFRNLVQTSFIRSHNPSHAPSRAGSGTYGGLNVIGLGSLSNNSHSNPAQTTQASSSKLTSSPSIPGSFSPNPDQKGPTLLKDTRFFKRIMAEDVEPTLRLDLSPTISWLNRRSILTALIDSTLIVEPIPEASLKLYGKYTSCAMCGESRKENQNPRTHAMRVREGEGATKWSICCLCLIKVRGVGDLIAYVRMIREGVVKVGDRKEEEEVWEELIKLRERLFWARMAGGVVPSFLPSAKNSPVVGIDNKGAGAVPEKEDSFHDSHEEPALSGRDSDQEGHSTDEETQSDRETRLQLQQGLDDSFTTFDNMKEKGLNLEKKIAENSTPPSTPPRKRGSGRFPQISIPKLPQGFWETQINTIH